MTKQRSKRVLLVVLILGLLGVLTVLLLVVGFLLLEPMIRRRAVAEAEQRGFTIVIGDVDYGLNWVTLRDTRFQLQGVAGVRGTAKTVEIMLDGLTPSSFEVDGVELAVEGSAVRLALELSEWSKDHPEAYRMPFSATGVNVSFSAPAGTPAWLILQQGSVVPSPAGGRFDAKRTLVEQVDTGPLSVTWIADQAFIALGFGAADPKRAALRLEVQPKATPPLATLTLAPTPLTQLAGPFGVKLPVENVVGSGVAQLRFTERAGADAVDGELSLALDGFVPPHPRELDGFVFGRTTHVTSKLAVSENRELVSLTDTRIKAGSFALKGAGELKRVEDHAEVGLDLAGALPCGELVSANLESYLGKTIGPLLKRPAKEFLNGSVSILVRIRADTRDLAAAKVLRTIGIGCGLKPLPIPDLAGIAREFEATFPGLAKQLPPLPDLPPMPSALPPLPKLPEGLPTIPTALPPFPKLEFPEPARRPSAAKDAGTR